jgi:UDP-N-acetylglucosamine diphosphorylase/glucosamine-1-phosphate N-acetyltransferase
MSNNGRQIFEDFEHLGIQDNRQIQTHYGVVITGNYPVFMDKSAEIEPGVVLVANDGPIYIGKHTKILAGSLIRGPFFLDDYSVVKMGAHLYKDTSVGKYCKIGGEISASIIHSFSNKSHGGYLGNSIIGEWCNLGADTNCSNLKNNYSDVRVQTFPDGKSVSTGLQFLGVMMGDHCKMSINTQINTGSVFGAFTNVALSGFPPKFLDAFTWLTDEGLVIHESNKAIQTARIVKERRGFSLDDSEQALFEALAIQRNRIKA